MVSEIFTVSKFTKEIKLLLEESYPFIWITGEISNCFTPTSNHTYFSLKDDKAVVNCVIFAGQKRNLNFEIENGKKIVGMARLSLYEPKGTYQLIFEHIDIKGTGSLHIAFDKLKAEFSAKGFFDDKHKKPIPFVSNKISIITSPTGAAVRDIINVFRRRFNNIQLEIVPVKVQGNSSAFEIKNAIELVNELKTSDLIILARGGGSFEDLAAFNTEEAAMAVFNSEIPVITGIGHETDYSICDFVSDLRAPTPSAAAEIALPEKDYLFEKINMLNNKLIKNIVKNHQFMKERVSLLAKRLKNPDKIISELRINLDDKNIRILNVLQYLLKTKDIQLKGLYKRLDALNPSAVLKRGYSITRKFDDKNIVKHASNLKENDLIETILYTGSVVSRVEKQNG